MFEEFEIPEHIDWLKQLEKELKSEPQAYEIAKNLWANPFLPHEPQNPLLIKSSGKDWIIAQKSGSNKQIIDSLNGGVNGISLDLRNTKENLSELLKGVYTDMLSLRLELKDEDIDLKALQSLADKDNQDWIFSGISRDAFLNLPKEVLRHSSLELKEENDPVELWVKAVQIWTEHPEVKTVFYLSAHENFYLNLTRIKAFRHIVRKLEKEHGREPGSSRVFIGIKADEKDENLRNIHLTQMVASSIFGGADRIEIENEANDEFNRRIQRNIQHILYHESFLNRVADPALGSYFLDDLTQKWVTNLWDNFLNRIK